MSCHPSAAAANHKSDWQPAFCNADWRYHDITSCRPMRRPIEGGLSRSCQRALSDQRGSRRSLLIAGGDEPQIKGTARRSVPSLQLVTPGDPLDSVDVRPLSAVAAERRRPAVRTRHRRVPRDSADVGTGSARCSQVKSAGSASAAGAGSTTGAGTGMRCT